MDQSEIFAKDILVLFITSKYPSQLNHQMLNTCLIFSDRNNILL